MVAAVRDMAYVGATPWHGLGAKLTEGADLETWAREAGLQYDVRRSRVRFGEGDTQKVWDDKHVLFRSDTKEPLAVVSNRYEIVQPSEVLGFFRNLTEEMGFTLETAGTLYQGARYWALAKTPLGFTLPGGDVVKQYILLGTSVDGSMATTGADTSVRVVCNNTLRAALSDSRKSAIKVRHSSKFDATKMQVDMGLLEDRWGAFEQTAKKLAVRRITRQQAVAVLIDAIGDSERPIEDQPNARPMAEMIRLFDGSGIGSSMESANGTLWGLVNAATEWSDHKAGRLQDSRLHSAWFGQNADRKGAVLASAVKVLERELPAPRSSAGGGILDLVVEAGVRPE